MKRKSVIELAPSAYKAMMGLEEWGQTCNLPILQKELIKIRASQINGCAYCIDMHTEDALKHGETARRIFAISVWHESHLFTEEERVLLQLTEEVTLISEKGVTDDTYNKAVTLFGEELTVQIIMLIVTINSWNRITVATKQVFKA